MDVKVVQKQKFWSKENKNVDVFEQYYVPVTKKSRNGTEYTDYVPGIRRKK